MRTSICCRSSLFSAANEEVSWLEGGTLPKTLSMTSCSSSGVHSWASCCQAAARSVSGLAEGSLRQDGGARAKFWPEMKLQVCVAD